MDKEGSGIDFFYSKGGRLYAGSEWSLMEITELLLEGEEPTVIIQTSVDGQQ